MWNHRITDRTFICPSVVSCLTKLVYECRLEENTLGPYHRFWLLKESEYEYRVSHLFISRDDAPLRLGDRVVNTLFDTFAWIPIIHLDQTDQRADYGLTREGVSIIHHEGGEILQKICLSWTRLFRLGPEQIFLRQFYSLRWPFETREYLLREDELYRLPASAPLSVEREWLVGQLTQLADYGEQVATGKYFLLHVGI